MTDTATAAVQGLPDLMDEMEAAAYLRLSERTLQGWRSKGKGPVFIRQGRRIAYMREDLLDFARSSRVIPAPKEQRDAYKARE